MASGAPLSPTTMSEIPKWLKHSRPRSFMSGAYMIKMLILATTCILLGWSVSHVYNDEEAIRPRPKQMDATYEILQVDGPRRPSLENNYLESHRHGSPADVTGHDYSHDKESAHSIYHKITDKLSTFNPWKPGSSYHEDNTWSSTASHSDASNKDDKNNPHPSYDNISESLTTQPPSPYGMPSRIGKITILTGGRNTVYERALRTHALHNKEHSYPMYTLRQSILADVWSKPAYILSVMMRELAKPASERLEWLFWVDADTVILNPYVPIEIFLPPSPEFDHVHMLATYDWNGLNNGIFPIRVCEWSVNLLAAILAFPHYKPDEELVFRDQSAMAKLIEEPKFASHVLKAPQRWFNAYQGEVNETLGPFQVRRGDFLVHFAGVIERDERMGLWLDRAEMHVPEWEVELKYTSYPTEVKEFWSDMRQEKKVHEVELDKVRKEAEDEINETKRMEGEYRDRLDDEDKKRIDEGIAKMEEILRNEESNSNVGVIRKGMDKLEESRSALDRLSSSTAKLLLTQAHDLAFEAERAIMDASTNPELQEVVESIDAALSVLKDLFMDKHVKISMLDTAVGVLRDRYGVLQRKMKDLDLERQKQQAKEDLENDQGESDADRPHDDEERENDVEEDHGDGEKDENRDEEKEAKEEDSTEEDHEPTLMR